MFSGFRYITWSRTLENIYTWYGSHGLERKRMMCTKSSVSDAPKQSTCIHPKHQHVINIWILCESYVQHLFFEPGEFHPMPSVQYINFSYDSNMKLWQTQWSEKSTWIQLVMLCTNRCLLSCMSQSLLVPIEIPFNFCRTLSPGFATCKLVSFKFTITCSRDIVQYTPAEWPIRNFDI